MPRFRLLRNVLHLDPTSPKYQQAQEALQTSKWIQLLQSSQWPDGTWGRFHTQDTSIKQPIATTEGAIQIALDSGLDKDSPILQKVSPVIQDYMDGKYIWPDTPEKHDNPLGWYKWVPQVSAAILAQFDRNHPRLEDFWNMWAETVRVSFQSGVYDRQAEIAALNRLLDCHMKKTVPFHVKYPLLILSATTNRLPETLERLILDYVMNSPTGIYYVYDRKINDFIPLDDRHFWGWIMAHKLLSRFRLWKEMAEDALNWIWDLQSEDGFWEPESKIALKPFSVFPLSEDWKRSEDRKIDGTVEILGYISRCFDQENLSFT